MKRRSANQAARLLPLGALVLRKADSENSYLVHEVGIELRLTEPSRRRVERRIGESRVRDAQQSVDL
jgi:hypothetical protein